MFGTFLLGIVAGWAAPYAEPKIKPFLESILANEAPVQPREATLFSLALCLFAAAILSMIFAVPHAAALALGAGLGIFGPRLVDKWKANKSPDYDS